MHIFKPNILLPFADEKVDYNIVRICRVIRLSFFRFVECSRKQIGKIALFIHRVFEQAEHPRTFSGQHEALVVFGVPEAFQIGHNQLLECRAVGGHIFPGIGFGGHAGKEAAAMTHILKMSEERPEVPVLDGLVGPAHVSTIIGSGPYEVFARDNRLPVVVTGFEPLDMLYAILMMVRQVNDGRHEVENEFTRAVTRDGNVAAIRLMDEVFELRDSFEWRGLGRLPKSALKLRPEWADFDAEKRFAMTERAVTDNKACACGAILRGEKTPEQCPLFGRACNPANPIGACMVSSEGACAAAWSYGRRRAAAPEKAKTSDDQR